MTAILVFLGLVGFALLLGTGHQSSMPPDVVIVRHEKRTTGCLPLYMFLLGVLTTFILLATLMTP